jgi:nitronate monooxygenase
MAFTFGELEHPIVAAPLGGGPSTVALAAAVSAAGGLGFLAAGYRSAADVREDIEAVRAATDRPFGVNVFVPAGTPAEPGAVQAYASRLCDAGLEVGDGRWDDDGWSAKVELLLAERPPVASFTFGLPDREVIAELRERGVAVWVTVTTPAEAAAARAAGADAVVCQGIEAGGHRGGFDAAAAGELGLLALLQLTAAAVDVPMVAAGGIATGRAIAAVLAAGASAAALGTAFMRTPEAGTAAAHREALAGDRPTALTLAFSGRPARGIVNAFMREHGSAAPLAYPEVHHLTTPARAAARRAGDAEGFNLWAGQAHALATDEPAGDLVRRLAAEARAALG